MGGGERVSAKKGRGVSAQGVSAQGVSAQGGVHLHIVDRIIDTRL